MLQPLVDEFPDLPEYRNQLAHAHDGLATVLGGLGRRLEASKYDRLAVEQWEILAARFPEREEYRVRLVECLSYVRFLIDPSTPPDADALYLAEKWVALVPDDPWAWNTLAWVHYLSGDYRAAVGDVVQSHASEPDLTDENLLLRAMATWKAGNKEEARALFEGVAKSMDARGAQDKDLRRCRADAAQLLGIDEKPPDEKEKPDEPSPP